MLLPRVAGQLFKLEVAGQAFWVARKSWLERLEPFLPWWSCWYYGSADTQEELNG
jgi:hypothetical protein